MKPIGTIEEELALCRAEIAKYPGAKMFWCLHHEQLFEESTERIENRIAYILKEKPEAEQAIRFRNLRPVKDPQGLQAALAECQKVEARALAEYEKVKARAWAEYEKVEAPAWAEYEKVEAPAWAECADRLNAEWPDNTWAGKSIFA